VSQKYVRVFSAVAPGTTTIRGTFGRPTGTGTTLKTGTTTGDFDARRLLDTYPKDSQSPGLPRKAGECTPEA